ncbi:MAG: thiamine pyrophosphate-dependent dehydrogenase E1 component subunit alpha [Candidatus Eremiobacteraeota bacterium]|nr:thiamine pyrophosphate-dependent dehydrogenase E1 component subunit alpha [Candidatus Eremiobacteraeota bacterium]
MIVIRRIEETLNDLFARGKLFGTTHLCVGQEAVAVGACYPLRKDDLVASTHRGHSHALAKGVSLRKLMAELLGKDEGLCRGRGGTQHLSDISVGFLGTNGITGGLIPVATGAALAFKMKKQDNVVVSFFGDGASNTGVFHESINFASIKKLPVIYICENNLYAMSIHVKRSTSVENIAQRASAYSIPGVIVDGMDPLAVEKAMVDAVNRARKGEGPTLIEAKTYRYLGHSKSDRRVYRTREEEKYWMDRDAIQNLSSALIENNVAADEEIEAIFRDAENEVKSAVDWAVSLPDPSVDDVASGLFQENNEYV